jgi:hypothetical protein
MQRKLAVRLKGYAINLGQIGRREGAAGGGDVLLDLLGPRPATNGRTQSAITNSA